MSDAKSFFNIAIADMDVEMRIVAPVVEDIAVYSVGGGVQIRVEDMTFAMFDCAMVTDNAVLALMRTDDGLKGLFIDAENGLMILYGKVPYNSVLPCGIGEVLNIDSGDKYDTIDVTRISKVATKGKIDIYAEVKR